MVDLASTSAHHTLTLSGPSNLTLGRNASWVPKNTFGACWWYGSCCITICWDCYFTSSRSPTGVDHDGWPWFHLNPPLYFNHKWWGPQILPWLKCWPITECFWQMVVAWMVLRCYESILVPLLYHHKTLSYVGHNGWPRFHLNAQLFNREFGPQGIGLLLLEAEILANI